MQAAYKLVTPDQIQENLMATIKLENVPDEHLARLAQNAAALDLSVPNYVRLKLEIPLAPPRGNPNIAEQGRKIAAKRKGKPAKRKPKSTN